MAVYLPEQLPAVQLLRDEGFRAFPTSEAPTGALRVGLLNLMPLKEPTEADIARALSGSAYDIVLSLHNMASHRSRNTSESHISRFYTSLTDSDLSRLNALIITGAPIELLPFHEVDYWNEFCLITDRMRQLRRPLLLLCWAAFAGLHHLFGIDKTRLPAKISGVYPHRITLPSHPLVAGISEPLNAPQSRNVTINANKCNSISELSIVATSDKTGPHILSCDNALTAFITGHGEYAIDTLGHEYQRDRDRGLNPALPENYFLRPDDPSSPPIGQWIDDGRRVFSNWIDLIVAPSARQKHATDCHSQA